MNFLGFLRSILYPELLLDLVRKTNLEPSEFMLEKEQKVIIVDSRREHRILSVYLNEDQDLVIDID